MTKAEEKAQDQMVSRAAQQAEDKALERERLLAEERDGGTDASRPARGDGVQLFDAATATWVKAPAAVTRAHNESVGAS